MPQHCGIFPHGAPLAITHILYPFAQSESPETEETYPIPIPYQAYVALELYVMKNHYFRSHAYSKVALEMVWPTQIFTRLDLWSTYHFIQTREGDEFHYQIRALRILI